MLALIRKGKAAALIATDLTRLYRNQSETNSLLEIVFPALGVRFVAITNGYDSDANMESDEDLAMLFNLLTIPAATRSTLTAGQAELWETYWKTRTISAYR